MTTARITLLVLLVLQTVGCETNPYTKRSQFLAVPKSYERNLGAQAYQQVLNDPALRLSQDPRELEPVQRVADRIIAVAKQSKYADSAREFDWHVSVIKDDATRNAFALPGGKIAVYTGLFPAARNEAGLAAILGHEVVHALARHGAERMSQGVLAQVGLAGAAVALQTQGFTPLTSQAAMAALGIGTQVGILLPFSRKHESEADYVGLLLAAGAGYDPREAVQVWERMEAGSGGQPSEFLSTHPSHGTRIKQLQDWLPEAIAVYDNSPRAPAAALPPVGVQ